MRSFGTTCLGHGTLVSILLHMNSSLAPASTTPAASHLLGCPKIFPPEHLLSAELERDWASRCKGDRRRVAGKGPGVQRDPQEKYPSSAHAPGADAIMPAIAAMQRVVLITSGGALSLTFPCSCRPHVPRSRPASQCDSFTFPPTPRPLRSPPSPTSDFPFVPCPTSQPPDALSDGFENRPAPPSFRARPRPLRTPHARFQTYSDNGSERRAGP